MPHSQNNLGSIWDKVSVICFLNLLCFGAFYLSTTYATELSPSTESQGQGGSFLAAGLMFFVGLLARPLGAIWFGLRGDLLSPGRAIKESIILMIGATAMMGLLPEKPTAEDPYFVLLRGLQGVGLGGAYGAMAVYLFEAAPAGSKGRITSFVQLSVAIGYIVSLLGVLLLKMIFALRFYQEGGWRLAFFMPVVGLFFLGILNDSAAREKLPWRSYLDYFKDGVKTVKAHGADWLPALFLSMGIGVLAITAANFKFYFMKVILRLDPVIVDFSSGLAALLFLPGYFLGGWLYDRYDKYNFVFGCLWIGSALMLPGFWILSLATQQMSGQIFKIVIGVWLSSSILVVAFGGMIAFMCDLFPKKMRCTLFALSYNVSVGFMGSLVHGYGVKAFTQEGFRYGGPVLAVALAGLCGVVCIYWRRRKPGLFL